MAIHSRVLAWRIPGMGEPGGLPSMGLHRVGHDWSDLAAAMISYTDDKDQDFSRECLCLPLCSCTILIFPQADFPLCGVLLLSSFHPAAISLRGLLLYVGSYHPVLKTKQNKTNLPSFCLIYFSKHSSENITSLGKCKHYPATLAYSGHNSQL